MTLDRPLHGDMTVKQSLSVMLKMSAENRIKNRYTRERQREIDRERNKRQSKGFYTSLEGQNETTSEVDYYGKRHKHDCNYDYHKCSSYKNIYRQDMG